MDKKLPIALFMALLMFLMVTFFFGEKPEKGAGTGSDPAASAETGATGAPVAVDFEPAGAVERDTEERTLELTIGEVGTRGSYRVVFTNRGARIKDLWLTNFYDRVGHTEEEKLQLENWIHLVESAQVDGGRIASLEWRASPSAKALLDPNESLPGALWQMAEVREAGRSVGVDFTYAPGTGVRFRKRVRFQPGSYELRVDLEIENVSAGDAVAGPRQFEFTPAAAIHLAAPKDRFYNEPQAVAGSLDGGEVEVEIEVLEKSVPKRTRESFPTGDGLAYSGVHNKYFAMIMWERGAPDAPPSMLGTSWRKLRDLAWLSLHPGDEGEAWRVIVTDVDLQLTVPKEGQTRTTSYTIYAGPKAGEEMLASNPGLDAMMSEDLGFFGGISELLLKVLGFFHGLTGNWGVAIILLTFTLRLVLFPVNRRSQTAMARYQTKMKRIQPKIDELKKKYADDVQKQRQEQAKLMQTEGAMPPVGGCLPMFLQIPVFWGLFSALRVSFDLRQAPFAGWITDLSKPDALMPLGWKLPLLGWPIDTLNVLPPLMVVLWIVQQRSMPTPADEQAQRMQKIMMWMPILFGVMLYNYAAGLSLYMITQSGLLIFEQRVIKKFWPVDDTEQPKKKDGFLARMAKAQEEQMKRLQAQQQQKARQHKNRKKRV